MSAFNAAMCTIFARESLEGTIIVGQYRMAIHRGFKPVEGGPTKDQLLRATYVWAGIATVVALLVVIAVAIPLAVLSKDFDKKTAEIIEGVSKVVAAICVLQLSLKIPRWLGIYKNKKNGKLAENFDLTLASIRFNIAWNVWREVAECGVFLLPSFLHGEDLKAVPVSALIGIMVGTCLGLFIYYGNQRFNNKMYLAVSMTLLMVFLSVGLFVGGTHEFEEVWGETPNVWKIENSFWSHKKLPMAALKPFGYSSKRSVLQIATFWSWLALTAILHTFMIFRTHKINQEFPESKNEQEKDTEHEVPETARINDV